MKSIAATISLCLWLLMVATPAAPKSPQARDPLFGLSYSPATVRFEEAGPAILSACPELTNAKWGRQMWIYAKTASPPDGEYLVLGGFFVKRESQTGAKQALSVDSLGVLLHLNGASCDLIGPAREVFDYKPEEIATVTLEALAKDAVRRYAIAFGSKERFLDALRLQKVDLSNPRSSILKNAVSAASR